MRWPVTLAAALAATLLVAACMFLARDHHTMTRDDKAIAYWTGRIDARRGRPRRVHWADRSEIGRTYTRGYDAWQDQEVSQEQAS